MLQPVELMHRLESLLGTETIRHTIADLKVKLTQNSEACSILLEEVDRCIADVSKLACSWVCCGTTEPRRYVTAFGMLQGQCCLPRGWHCTKAWRGLSLCMTLRLHVH